MKTSDGSFLYTYNAQIGVDNARRMIVATRLENHSAGSPAFCYMLEQVTRNCDAITVPLLVDAVHFSEDSVMAAEPKNINPLIATERLRHGEVPPAARRAWFLRTRRLTTHGPQTTR
jgi:hypothetical protein